MTPLKFGHELELRSFALAILATGLEIAAARRGDEPPDDRGEYLERGLELFNRAGELLSKPRGPAA